MARWYNVRVVQWRSGSLANWYNGTMVQCVSVVNFQDKMAKNWLKKAIFDHFFWALRATTGFVLEAKLRKAGI